MLFLWPCLIDCWKIFINFALMKALRRIPKHASLWFYVLAVACIIVQLLAVEYHFNKIANVHWLSRLDVTTVSQLALNAIADAVLLMSVYLLLPPKRRKWCWIVLWLVMVWCLAQLLYMPTYRDLMPFSSFLLVGNVGDTLAKSIMGSLRVSNLEVVLPPVVLYIIYRVWLKRGIENARCTAWQRVGLFLLSLVVFAGIRLGVTAWHYSDDDDTHSLAEQFTNDYGVMWTSQGDYVNINGAVPYAMYCAYTSIFNKATLTPEQKNEVIQFLNDQPQVDEEYATARGKNVIVLVVESLNSWVIDLRLNGREVTPTLNALCRDTVNNLVSTRMKSQVKNGRSSDGIFMYNTGLLPLVTQVVVNTYGDVPYPSLPKILGDYDSFYACCDEPNLWNVEKMASNYGYSNFYGKSEIRDAVNSNGYLLDKALLEEVVQLIPERKQPFLALVATAGMHHPYGTPMEPETWVQQTGLYTREVRCYLECANAFDTALSQFIESLKSQGKLDNTMLVIVSDHNEMVDDAPGGRPSIDKEGDNCVFLAINSGQNGRIAGPFGQIDVFPTLLELLGATTSKWNGLGYSVLSNDVHSVATSPTSTTGGGTLLKRQQQAWTISDMIITSRWFDKDDK